MEAVKRAPLVILCGYRVEISQPLCVLRALDAQSAQIAQDEGGVRWIHEIAVSAEKWQPAMDIEAAFHAPRRKAERRVLQRLLILLRRDKRALLQIAGPLHDRTSQISVAYENIVSVSD